MRSPFSITGARAALLLEGRVFVVLLLALFVCFLGKQQCFVDEAPIHGMPCCFIIFTIRIPLTGAFDNSS